MVDLADGDVAAGRQGGGDGKHQGETSLLTPNLFSSIASVFHTMSGQNDN